jgi:hypothetical protein
MNIFIKEYCPKVKTVYLWMDYCCVLQDLNNDSSSTQRKTISLENVIQLCDCIYTPLYSAKDIDKDADLLLYSESSNFQWYNLKSPKQLHAWHDEQSGFLRRSWCRLEIFYNLNLPVRKQPEKAKCFTKCMKHFLIIGSRPHFIYNGIVKKVGVDPHDYLLRLPLLSNKYLSDLNPIYGFFSRHYDKDVIRNLLINLRTYVKPVFQGFRGLTDDVNKALGRGEVHFGDDVYIGDFKFNFANGEGTYAFATGDYYEGFFLHGKKTGKGKLMRTNGDVYIGEFKLDEIYGKGEYTFNDESTYVGDFVRGNFEGSGLRKYPDGTEYKGDWIGNMKVHGEFKQVSVCMLYYCVLLCIIA